MTYSTQDLLDMENAQYAIACTQNDSQVKSCDDAIAISNSRKISLAIARKNLDATHAEKIARINSGAPIETPTV